MCLKACLILVTTCLGTQVMLTNQRFVFTFNMVTCLIACLFWWHVLKLFIPWWHANEGTCYWWFYPGDVFGSYLYLGDMQMRALAIGDFILVMCLEAIYTLVTCKWGRLLLVMCMKNTNKIAKLEALIVSNVLKKCLFLVTWSEVCLFKWCVWECKWC
jgi:hypothetical protein